MFLHNKQTQRNYDGTRFEIPAKIFNFDLIIFADQAAAVARACAKNLFIVFNMFGSLLRSNNDMIFGKCIEIGMAPFFCLLSVKMMPTHPRFAARHVRFIQLT